RLVDRMMSPRLQDRPGSAAEALVTLSGVEAMPPTVGPASASAESTPTLPRALPRQPEELLRETARIGAWELGEVIFSSTNWLARVVTHVHTGNAARLVRLKPTGPLANKSDFILAAAERASRFNHPNLVNVIDWGLFGGRVYVVLTAQGRTLKDLVDNSQPLEEHDA